MLLVQAGPLGDGPRIGREGDRPDPLARDTERVKLVGVRHANERCNCGR